KLLKKEVYIFNHNLESLVYKSLYCDKNASFLRRLFCFFEYIKIFLSERFFFRMADGISSINSNEVPKLANVKSLVLLPYSHKPFELESKCDVPTAIIIGSFHWRIKQHNLMVFLDSFHREYMSSVKKCSIIVAGSAPGSFFLEIKSRYPFVTIVDDFNSLNELSGIATIGICPDQAGGGFKLKTLDYFKLNLPMVAIENGASGLVEPVVPSYDSFTILAKEVYSLLYDEKRRNCLLLKQYNYFTTHHSEMFFLDKLKLFIE
ncbi:TPA: hypothetical protein ACGG7M_003158, partial [Vibrio cholerae]